MDLRLEVGVGITRACFDRPRVDLESLGEQGTLGHIGKAVPECLSHRRPRISDLRAGDDFFDDAAGTAAKSAPAMLVAARENLLPGSASTAGVARLIVSGTAASSGRSNAISHPRASSISATCDPARRTEAVRDERDVLARVPKAVDRLEPDPHVFQ